MVHVLGSVGTLQPAALRRKGTLLQILVWQYCLHLLLLDCRRLLRLRFRIASLLRDFRHVDRRCDRRLVGKCSSRSLYAMRCRRRSCTSILFKEAALSGGTCCCMANKSLMIKSSVPLVDDDF